MSQDEGCLKFCFCCLSDDTLPDDKDPRGYNTNTFKTTMLKSPCNAPGSFCLAFLCPCPANFKLRRDVLGGDMSKYTCCQGFYSCCCFRPGEMGEQSCPNLCLCLETWCCLHMAVSSSRMYVMDQKGLMSDPCDRRLIRCNNCLQCFACIFSIMAIFVAECRDAAECVRFAADLMFCCVQACMCAQVATEISEDSKFDGPNKQSMEDNAHLAAI